MQWSWEYAVGLTPLFLNALWMTLAVTLGALLVALVFGTLLAAVQRVRVPGAALVARTVMNFLRGTPLLVQVFFVYFGAPHIGIVWEPLTIAILVLGLHNSGHTAEVFRASIDGIPKGQHEACASLKFSRTRAWLSVLGPQAVARAVPPLGNVSTIIFKDTAVLFVIGAPVLMAVAQAEASRSFNFLESYTVVSFFYFAVGFAFYLLVKYLERRFEWALRVV